MYEFSTLNWFDKPLVYTEHATSRAEERNTPRLDYLPVNAELVSHDKQDCTFAFKTIHDNKYLVLIVSEEGDVLTTYYNGCVVKPKRRNMVRFNKSKIYRRKKGKARIYDIGKYPFLEIQNQLFDYA